jgi:phosphopantothenoylcysteine decarboxylase/phosphopantothenate--cysteine ligase
VLVGFAAETNDVEAYARGKLERKRLDFIVANDVSAAGSGFGTDTNRVLVLGTTGEAVLAEGPKREVARAIWDVVLGRVK